MTERNAASEESSDERLLRAGLHSLVEGVEPERNALARLLARRRRRMVLRSVFVGSGVAVATTVVLLFALVVPNGLWSTEPVPVGIGPDSYLVRSGGGSLVAVSLESGDVIRELGDPGDLVAVARGRDRVYVAPATGGVVAMGSRRTEEPLEGVPEGEVVTALAAAGERVAVAYEDRVLVVSDGGARRIGFEPGLVVRDVAVESGGRLALVVQDRDGSVGLRTVVPGEDGPRRLGRSVVSCGPTRVTWTSTGLAVLRPVSCGDGESVRITTVDPREGTRLAGGVRVGVGAPVGQSLRLSADTADRMLVSAGGNRNWLVEGGTVRSVPCPDSGCSAGTAVM
ncbi:hypothetical protein [Actinopolyspora mortivallis]|uniref:hypothetical protein n=1 Tax=Actinopolyspora mortivallis TaxID=33906 RepID=UPI000361DE99|nr:hypothetical protein [Actinopolyspora mortivallis]